LEDLAQWLRAQLYEEEQIARAATQGEWVWSREFVTPPGYHHRTIGPLEPGDAAYIAQHDPARVLQEIAIDRELLREYSGLLDAYAWHMKAQAELQADIDHENRTGRWVGRGDPAARQQALRREADYLPGTLRILEKWARAKAAVYADRPGYLEKWRP